MTGLPRSVRWGLIAAAALVVALVSGMLVQQIATDEERHASLPSAPPSPPPPVARRTPVRIMPLGDSITLGIGSATVDSYRVDLRRRLTEAGLPVDFVGSLHDGRGPDVDHEGHSGWTIDRLTRQVDGWLAAYQPDVVLLHIGTNDLRTDAGATGAPERLATLISRLQADRPDAEIFIATLVGARLADYQRRIDTFNAAVPAIVTAHGGHVHLVDQSTVDELDIRDNLHPNDYGYAKMSFNWYTAMRTAFAASWPPTSNPYLATEAYRCLLRATYPGGRYKGVVTCAWYRRDTVVGTARDAGGAVYR